jgi:hypothetical protein
MFDNIFDDDTPVSTPSWVNLVDLSEHSPHRILTIRPRRRTYLHQSDAGYDWAAGREFIITSQSSPYYGSVVAVDEKRNLKDYGYTHVHIHYNITSVPLEIAL